MTALGKTLVFFNLLFALVTGGLIVMVFLTRTNWKKGMDDAVQETKAARAALKQEQESGAQRKIDFENQNKKLQEEISRLKNVIQGKDEEIAAEKKRVEEQNTVAVKATTISSAASAEITRLQLERNQMAEQQKKLNDDLVKAAKDLADTTARETYNKLRADALEKDLAQKSEELATLKRKYEELAARAPANRNGAEANPRRAPAIETSGRISGVDGNLASITLGSDHGIQRGHILQVFRPDPNNPIYLGTLVVTRTEAHRAVGTFEPAGTGKRIAPGDTVDTKILR